MSNQRAMLVAMMIALCSGSAVAQGSAFVPTLREGDTLKVWAVAPRLNGVMGVLGGLRSDTLTLGEIPVSAPPVVRAVVPYASLRRIDVRRGKARSPVRIGVGILVGAVAGGALGAAVGPAIECAGGCAGDYGGLAGFVFGAGTGIIAGGVAGGILGARRVPKWESVTFRR